MKNSSNKRNNQLLSLFLLLGGAYYFFIYLPDQKKKTQSSQTQTPQKTPEELKREQEEDAKAKGRIWDLPIHSWADREVKKLASTLIKKYQEDAAIFPNGDRNSKFSFSRAASYKIYFPPALRAYYEKGKDAEDSSCDMIENTEELILSDKILQWEAKVIANPTRGESDNNKKDNSAIFYGAPGTGKTATVKNICVKSNKYPLVEIKGSALTPTKEDQDSKLLPLKKFVYTISELEWTLVETYGFEREANGEVRYILFVDEADQISNNALTHDPTKLRFLKECLEGVNKKDRSNNLWVFATNHLEDVEPAVYREGRLSNPLDFSWTWGEFKKYADRFGISNQLPQHWLENDTLNAEDNKLMKRFNTKLFQKEFLGDDADSPSRPNFWNLFITNYPNAQIETEENEVDEQGNETGNKVKEDIEFGEFLEFFWGLVDSGDIMYYQGGFDSPRNPKIEETLLVLDNTLTNGINSLIISLDKMREEMEKVRSEGTQDIKNDISDIRGILAELRSRIDNRNL